MEQHKAQEGMSSDMLELVLRELFVEQQKANDMVADQAKMLSQLLAKLKEMEENARLPVMTPPTINTKPIEEIIKKWMVGFQTIVENQPKNITKKIQILLFPERDTALYCKIVFGRWVFWLVVMLCITDIYKWAVHWSDNQKELKQQKLVNSRIAKPHILSIRQQGKEGKSRWIVLAEKTARLINHITKYITISLYIRVHIRRSTGI